jgi:hypothetical protein
VAGTCECGKEPSVCIKCREFLDQLRNGQLEGNNEGRVEVRERRRRRRKQLLYDLTEKRIL